MLSNSPCSCFAANSPAVARLLPVPCLSLSLCLCLSLRGLFSRSSAFSVPPATLLATSLSLSLALLRTVFFFSNGRAVCYGFIFFATRTRNYNFSFNLSCVFLGKHYDNTWGQSPRLASGQTAASGCLSSLSHSLSTYTLGRRLCVVYQPGYWLLLQLLLLLLLCLLTACYFYGFVAKANFAHKLQQKDKQQ